MKQNKYMIIIGIVLLMTVIVLVAFAPVFTSFDPLETNTLSRLSAPNFTNIAGTDNYGRDIYSRLLYGGRTTLAMSFITLSLTGILGVALGTISAMNYGNIIDTIIMRIVDVLIALPFMALAMAITALFGRGFDKLLFVVIIIWWVPFARLTRSLILSMQNDNSILAAKILGASKTRIVFREILPKIINPIIINITFELGSLILTIATLSFFGLGSLPPDPEWGSMLSDGREQFFRAPHMLIAPSIFIFITVLGLNLIGEGLRDLFDPYDVLDIRQVTK